MSIEGSAVTGKNAPVKAEKSGSVRGPLFRGWVSMLVAWGLLLGLVAGGLGGVLGESAVAAETKGDGSVWSQASDEQKKVAQDIVATAMSMGYSKEFGAGMAGNAWAESMWTPTVSQGAGAVAKADADAAERCDANSISNAGGAAIGTYQFDGDLKKVVVKWVCENNDNKWNDVVAQTKWVIHSFNGDKGAPKNLFHTEASFNGIVSSGEYASLSFDKKFLTAEEFKTTTDVENATLNFVAQWERAGVPHFEKRIAAARDVMDNVDGQTKSTKTVSTDPETEVETTEDQCVITASSSGGGSGSAVASDEESEEGTEGSEEGSEKGSESSGGSDADTAVWKGDTSSFQANSSLYRPDNNINIQTVNIHDAFGAKPNGDKTVAPVQGKEVTTNPQVTKDIKAVQAAVIKKWGDQIGDLGDFRNEPGSDHGTGRAVDIMIPNYETEEGRALGDEVAKYFADNHEKYGVTYLIWYNGFWLPPGVTPAKPEWKAGGWGAYNGGGMYGAGSLDDTTYHFDHVHVSVSGDKSNVDVADIETGEADTTEKPAAEAVTETVSTGTAECGTAPIPLEKDLVGMPDTNYAASGQTFIQLPTLGNLSITDALTLAEVKADLDADKVTIGILLATGFSAFGYLMVMAAILLLVLYLLDRFFVIGDAGLISMITNKRRRTKIPEEGDVDDSTTISSLQMTVYVTALILGGAFIAASVLQGYFFGWMYDIYIFSKGL